MRVIEVKSCGTGSSAISRNGEDALWTWFGLSYASWLTLPRIMMHAMPDEWQRRMADLLNEYDEAFPGMPEMGTTVRITDIRGKLVKCPSWLLNYRHPNREEIEKARSFPRARPLKEAKS